MLHKIITIIPRSYRNKKKKAIFFLIGELLKIPCPYFLPIYTWALGLRPQTSCSLLSCWGRNKLSTILRGSFYWPNDQIDMKQINKKKMTTFNYICTYGNFTYKSEPETPHIWEVHRQKGKWGNLSKGKVRHIGTLEGHCRMIRRAMFRD